VSCDPVRGVYTSECAHTRFRVSFCHNSAKLMKKACSGIKKDPYSHTSIRTIFLI